MKYINTKPGEVVPIPSAPGTPEQRHLFHEDEITAINTALAARRALLVRGEPGTGKTQLAGAAAVALKRPIVSFVVDSRSESRDALWHFDAVRRLADAQVHGAMHGHRQGANAARSISGRDKVTASLNKHLDVENYIQPRALWWGLDWEGAKNQASRARTPPPLQTHDCDPANGVVILIDEIDKGDMDVPNGLLEVLGSGQFTIPGRSHPVTPPRNAIPPLVIITTNEERVLPDAFVRRCIVLTLRLPENDTELEAYLLERGRAHFKVSAVGEEVLTKAARLLIADRKTAQERRSRPLPGQAEFIDLIRAVHELAGTKASAQLDCLAKIARFALRKHPPGMEP